MAEDGVCGLICRCVASSVISCGSLKIGWRARSCVSARLLRGRAEATYEPVIGQRDANRLRHLQTNRPQLQHDPAVDVHRALHPLRLRVVDSHHVTHSDVTGRDVPYRHRPTVGRRRAEWPPRD
jgi:hypothetical protein